MQTIPVNQAKDKFSSLLQAVEDGDEVIITRHGKRVARLVREPDPVSSDSAKDRLKASAIEKLKAMQALVKPAVPGKSDWKSLRDAGRKY